MKKLEKYFILALFLGGLATICSCTKDPQIALNTESAKNDILSFSVSGETGPSTINSSNQTVVAEVECGTDLTSLAPTFTISDEATSFPNTGTASDYSSQVTIIVTAEDGTTANWQVTISEACATATDILTFSFPEETGAADIDSDNHTVDIEVPYGTNLANLTPVFTISDGATSNPTSESSGDYSAEVSITVTAEDGITTQDWKVNVSKTSPSDAADILTFSISEQTTIATIDYQNQTVAIEVKNATDRTSLTPTFTLSLGATSVPASETSGDFSSEVTIIVTAQDGLSTKDWKVNVTTASAGLSGAADILSFTLDEQVLEATIDESGPDIVINVQSGTDISNLAPNWTLSPGATSIPNSGTTSDYSDDFIIKVTAENGNIREWKVFVQDFLGPENFCDEKLCRTDEELKENCINFLTDCVDSEPPENHDTCIGMAISKCKL